MKSTALGIFLLLQVFLGYSQEKDSIRIEKEKKKEKVVLPWFVERFKLSAGGLYIINKTNIQVAVNGGEATPIDGEKDLGKILEVIEQPHQILCTIILNEKEALIPLHEDSLEKIDKKHRKIYVTLPDGLLDIYMD